MTTASVGQERSAQVAGLNLQYWEGGNGSPLVVIHHDIGSGGWSPFHDALAGSFHVLAPELPGYGKSDRPNWARHPRDLALLLGLWLDQLELDDVVLVGLGFGGWLAAEMAVMRQRSLRRLVLVGAMGIKPSEGEIVDQMLIDLPEYVEAGFANHDAYVQQFGEEVSREQTLVWDYAREMTARIAWKPYMFSHQLVHLLGGVQTPALVVWGRENSVVPLVCGEAYARALPNATLALVDDAGLWVDLEQPEALSRLIREHAGVA
ncbi:MAG: alpha/beta fold hydrolase [Dehalococcoidia bacterium]